MTALQAAANGSAVSHGNTESSTGRVWDLTEGREVSFAEAAAYFTAKADVRPEIERALSLGRGAA